METQYYMCWECELAGTSKICPKCDREREPYAYA